MKSTYDQFLRKQPIYTEAMHQKTKFATYEWNVTHNLPLTDLFAGEDWSPPPQGVFKLNFDMAVNPFYGYHKSGRHHQEQWRTQDLYLGGAKILFDFA